MENLDEKRKVTYCPSSLHCYTVLQLDTIAGEWSTSVRDSYSSDPVLFTREQAKDEAKRINSYGSGRAIIVRIINGVK